MPKKVSSSKEVNFMIAYAIIVIIFFSLAIMFIDDNQVEETKNQEEINQQSPSIEQIGDFSSTEGGSFQGSLNPFYFKEPIDQVVLLLASAKVPGLALIYYPYENKLIAGTPQMVAENIVLFDGNSHRIDYSFQRNGKQHLEYDGKVVAESEFKLYGQDKLTGLTTGYQEYYISESFDNVQLK